MIYSSLFGFSWETVEEDSVLGSSFNTFRHSQPKFLDSVEHCAVHCKARKCYGDSTPTLSINMQDFEHIALAERSSGL